MTFHKFPRTPHLVGSQIQKGDEDLPLFDLADLRERPVVVSEKVDGSNCALSFDESGRLLLQSRGDYLRGGPAELHFAPLKSWAATVQGSLWEVLGPRFVLYGEWCYAKHTVFYDALPHYFLEFDVLDREEGRFLGLDARRRLLEGLPVVSVEVVHQGGIEGPDHLASLLGPSSYRTDGWKAALVEAARGRGLDPERILAETDPSPLAEGLYLKVEEKGAVQARYKWVRPGFTQQVDSSGSHWKDRPLVPNRLRPGSSLFMGS